MNALLRSAAVAGLGLALAAPAFAGTSSAGLQASATVVPNCRITTSPLAFGNYDPLVANRTLAGVAQAPETVYCTAGSNPTLQISSYSGNMRGAGASTLSYSASLSAPDYGSHYGVTGYQYGITGYQNEYVWTIVGYNEYCNKSYCYSNPVYGYELENEPVYGYTPEYGQVANPATATSITSPITWTLNGTVPAGQDVATGAYQDSIALVLQF